MIETKFTTVGEITLHYRIEGNSTGLPLVFLNSLGTDLRIWDSVTAHFANRFPLIRYDKRGHGLSDSPAGPYTIRNLADDLAGLLDHLRIDDAILIGVSVGGMIALDYAINHPKKVKGLVLCDTAAKIGTAEMWNERIDTLRENGMAYLADTILARWFSPAFQEKAPAEYQGYRNMLLRIPLDGYIATCEAIRDADLRRGVATLQIPSLVVCGAEDASTPPDLVRSLAEMLPDAKFELIEQSGHLPGVEQPQALAAVIDQFLEMEIK